LSDDTPPPRLAIVGVTASGKSTLAMALARQHREIELVSVDSMQIYRGMDIGTAKPSAAERAEVPHHLIDLVDPCDAFTVAEFQRAAESALTGIEARGGVPVLVGGTGLHLRAVVDALELPGQFPGVVADLESEPDTEALHRRLQTLDPLAASRMEPSNRRRVLRALEVTVGSGRAFSSYGPGLDTYGPTRFTMIGPRWPRAAVDERIAARYRKQIADGFVEEVARLAADPRGLSHTAGQALGYRQLLEHVAGRQTLEEAVEDAVAATRRFARRQERWFRRDPRVRWIDVADNPMEASAAVMGEYRSCT